MPVSQSINLTPAEQEIVSVLAVDPLASNAEIAAQLGKAEKTIENQFRQLYRRAGLNKEAYRKRRPMLIALLNQR